MTTATPTATFKEALKYAMPSTAGNVSMSNEEWVAWAERITQRLSPWIEPTALARSPVAPAAAGGEVDDAVCDCGKIEHGRHHQECPVIVQAEQRRRSLRNRDSLAAPAGPSRREFVPTPAEPCEGVKVFTTRSWPNVEVDGEPAGWAIILGETGEVGVRFAAGTPQLPNISPYDQQWSVKHAAKFAEFRDQVCAKRNAVDATPIDATPVDGWPQGSWRGTAGKAQPPEVVATRTGGIAEAIAGKLEREAQRLPLNADGYGAVRREVYETLARIVRESAPEASVNHGA